MKADHYWQFSYAERILCLSPTMIEEVRATARCETSLLPFIRERSQYKAKCSDIDTLKIGQVETPFKYLGGFELLNVRLISVLGTSRTRVSVLFRCPL